MQTSKAGFLRRPWKWFQQRNTSPCFEKYNKATDVFYCKNTNVSVHQRCRLTLAHNSSWCLPVQNRPPTTIPHFTTYSEAKSKCRDLGKAKMHTSVYSVKTKHRFLSFHSFKGSLTRLVASNGMIIKAWCISRICWRSGKILFAWL